MIKKIAKTVQWDSNWQEVTRPLTVEILAKKIDEIIDFLNNLEKCDCKKEEVAEEVEEPEPPKKPMGRPKKV